MFQHPGGWEVMHEYAGYDGTLAFRGVGHTKAALKMMDKYLIGILPESQKIFSNKNEW
jgi:cytochrome b involved in lipid metabolism